MVYGKTTNSDRARKNQRKSAKLAAEALFIASYAVLRKNFSGQLYINTPVYCDATKKTGSYIERA
jgi:hypothetical protein